MIKKIGLIIVILLILISGGCWNKKEPKDLAIAESVLYDRVDNACLLVTEFMNLKGSSESGAKESNSTVISQGSTYREAIADSANRVNKSLYGGHVFVRFVSEAAAKYGIAEMLDFVLRDHLTDETPLLMVIKGKDPQNIYKCDTGLADSIGVYIKDSSVSLPKATSSSVFVTTLKFVKDFLNDAKEPVTGVIEIVKSEAEKPATSSESGGGSSSGSNPSYKLLLRGLAAFRDDKLVGFFNGDETRAYNFILGKIGSAIVSVPYQDSYVVCEVSQSTSDIKVKMDNENFTFEVKIKAKIRIIADATANNVSDLDVAKEIEGAFNKQLLPEIASAIEKAQKEFKSDIFGFGNSVHVQYPEQWRKIKKEWNDFFSKATVIVSVESSVFQTGETQDSILSEFSED